MAMKLGRPRKTYTPEQKQERLKQLKQHLDHTKNQIERLGLRTKMLQIRYDELLTHKHELEAS